MRYSELLATMQQTDDGVALQVPADWMQGRSVFGGLQVAIAVAAMRRLVATPMRTLQVTFIAPVPQGLVSARAKLLRSGKNASHVEAQLLVGGEIACSVIGVFGNARTTAVTKLPQQLLLPAAQPIPFPFVEGFTPEFTRSFKGAVLQGDLPYAGKPLSEVVVSLDMLDTGTTTEAHLLAIADFMPPVALCWLKNFAAGSSLTWMLEFLVDDFTVLPLTGWRVDATLVAARDGYTSQSVMLWGPGGVPVAISRQSMVVFG
jgi:acyl-coenzyme A thioesterase PaaI-like protein